jgi:hypothetical protein
MADIGFQRERSLVLRPYRVFNSDRSIPGHENGQISSCWNVSVQSKMSIFPKRDFLNLLREILRVEFFSAPIDSRGLYAKVQNGSPLDCHLSLDGRYERKGNLRRYE